PDVLASQKVRLSASHRQLLTRVAAMKRTRAGRPGASRARGPAANQIRTSQANCAEPQVNAISGPSVAQTSGIAIAAAKIRPPAMLRESLATASNSESSGRLKLR